MGTPRHASVAVILMNENRYEMSVGEVGAHMQGTGGVVNVPP